MLCFKKEMTRKMLRTTLACKIRYIFQDAEKCAIYCDCRIADFLGD